MRLNQFLAASGLGSRRACEELIRQGVVTINQKPASLTSRVEPSDIVKVRGKRVGPEPILTVLLNKPRGVICSTDPQSPKKRTVYDLLPRDWPRLVCAGRLDGDSEGLLILSNQGSLVQKLTHPSHKLPKVYRVKLNRPLEETDAAKLREGFPIEPGFARCDIVNILPHQEIEVVLRQGLKRQIRLMLRRLGYLVQRLKRIQVGGLDLKGTGPGHWRILTEREIRQKLLADPFDPSSSRRTLNRSPLSTKPSEKPHASLKPTQVKRPATSTRRSNRNHPTPARTRRPTKQI